MVKEKEYRKIIIALTCMNTVIMSIGLGFYIYDRKKPLQVINIK